MLYSARGTHGGLSVVSGALSDGAFAPLDVDFTALAAGYATSLPWVALARASADATVRDSATTVVTSIGANAARIGQTGGAGTRGLLLEGPLGVAYSARGAAMVGADWTTGSVGNTLTIIQAGPDGRSLAALVHVPSGGYSRSYAFPSAMAGTTWTLCAWMRGGSVSTWQAGMASPSTYAGGVLGTAWAPQVVHGSGVTLTGGSIQPVDGRDQRASGGIAAGQRDVYLDLLQVEALPYATSWAASRAADVLTASASQTVIRRGTVTLDVTFLPLFASSDIGARGGNRRLWETTLGDYAELDGATREVRVSIGGQVVVLSDAIASNAWSALDTVRLRVVAGQGAPSGWYAVNGGAQVSLGTGSAQGPVGLAGGVYLLCGSTPGAELEGYVQTIRAV